MAREGIKSRRILR